MTTMAGRIIRLLLKTLPGPGAEGQFASSSSSPAGRMNAAFLISLCGKEHPDGVRALKYLHRLSQQSHEGTTARFYLKAGQMISSEIAAAVAKSPQLKSALKKAIRGFNPENAAPWSAGTRKRLWPFFFPEGLLSKNSAAAAVKALRARRTVRITRPNPDPIREPSREILFTANVLLTIPHSAGAGLPASLLKKCRALSRNSQTYYYDHPIPLNALPDKHEVLYGLKALDNAMAFEKKRGAMAAKDKVTVLLSLSVTHDGLDKIAAPYLRQMLQTRLRLSHLNVYLFTEETARQLLCRVLLPAAAKHLRRPGNKGLTGVFGVVGEYGRHYSFLKAVAALWQVAMDHRIKATFKIDLDQVFPEKEVVRATGKSSLEHFRTPLWGAMARDNEGRAIELGMLAGALVDKKDLGRLPFKPDAGIPETIPAGAPAVFFSPLTRAISTHAEMALSLKKSGRAGGLTQAIQRFHVLGGVNGILIKSLRKYRPFTPTFISRAEDQAYLMSVLHARPGCNLRYVHGNGLIMRHDKDAVAGSSVKEAEAGRGISELLRLLQFTRYAQVLPWKVARTKACLDPFTGGFITPIPWTLAFLRFSLYLTECFGSGSIAEAEKGLLFQSLGVTRLSKAMAGKRLTAAQLRKQYKEEKKGWDLYYQTLDNLQKRLDRDDAPALKIRETACKIIEQCRLL